MAQNNNTRGRWLPTAVLILILSVVAPLAAGCGTFVCDVFNCNTLFFLDELAALVDQQAQTDGDHDANGGDMDMDGDNHEHRDTM